MPPPGSKLVTQKGVVRTRRWSLRELEDVCVYVCMCATVYVCMCVGVRGWVVGKEAKKQRNSILRLRFGYSEDKVSRHPGVLHRV